MQYMVIEHKTSVRGTTFTPMYREKDEEQWKYFYHARTKKRIKYKTRLEAMAYISFIWRP